LLGCLSKPLNGLALQSALGLDRYPHEACGGAEP